MWPKLRVGVSDVTDEVIRGLATNHSHQRRFREGQRVQRGRPTQKERERERERNREREWGRKSKFESEGTRRSNSRDKQRLAVRRADAKHLAVEEKT